MHVYHIYTLPLDVLRYPAPYLHILTSIHTHTHTLTRAAHADAEEMLAVSEKARLDAEAMVVELQQQLAALQQVVDAVSGQSEETQTLLQTNVRVAAGELCAVKEQYGALKERAAAMRLDMLEGMQTLSVEVLGNMTAVVGGMAQDRSDAVQSLKKEMTERKRLHNLVLDLKGNIRVFCRARPPGKEGKNALTFASETELLCDVAGKSHSFNYDCVFGPQSQQGTVFGETQPLVVSVLDGYHSCILAYGQTGSGKTHTMQGYDGDPGVNTRAINELFAIAKERAVSHSYSIKVTLIEIYNETLRDLLEPRDETGKDKALDVKLASSADASIAGFNSGTCVPGVSVAEVTCMEDVLEALKKGALNRTVAGTDMNEHSSRSHMVLSVFVEGNNLTNGVKTYGKLHLIDLAGSERLARSGAQVSFVGLFCRSLYEDSFVGLV